MAYADTALDGQKPTRNQMLTDVLAGMREPAKTLPCRFFYDERGSHLFEQICELDEYYVTRTELAIMREHAPGMARELGSECMLVELGSGSSLKTRLLLDHLDDPVAYVPVDISADQLEQTSRELTKAYPHIKVLSVCADFTQEFQLPQPARAARQRMVYFPGSTIGNFEEDQAVELLSRVAVLLNEQGGLLIGIDLKKDKSVLEAAYNDAAGVTAEFNLNLLRHLNREADADFDLARFQHRAVYNEEKGRIEMYLVSLDDQQVSIGDETFALAEGERICTEYSHKYAIDEFAGLAAQAGFELSRQWTDADGKFAVLLLATNL